jgi:hypothetical protein
MSDWNNSGETELGPTAQPSAVRYRFDRPSCGVTG